MHSFYIYSWIIRPIKISLYQEVLDNNLTNSTWFYKIPYNSIQLFVDRIPESQLNRSLGYYTSFKDSIFAPHEFFLRSSVYLVEYSYVFLTKAFTTFDTGAILTFENDHKFSYYHLKTVGRYKFGVQYVQFYFHFGHLIHDFLCALMYVPKFYYDVGFVVVAPPSGKHLADKYLRYLGLSKSVTVLNFNPEKEQVFVERLLVVTSLHYGNGYCVGGLQRLRQLFYKRFNVRGITPHTFSIINRPDKKRRINNIEELYNNLTLHVPTDPGEKWTIEPMNPDDFADTVKRWTRIKCLVAPGGSFLFNAIVMQPRTGILVMLGDMRDLPNVNLCSSLNISVVQVTHRYMGHDNFDPTIKCNVTLMVSGCKALLQVIRTGVSNVPEFVPFQFKRYPDILKKELMFLNGSGRRILDEPLNFA